MNRNRNHFTLPITRTSRKQYWRTFAAIPVNVLACAIVLCLPATHLTAQDKDESFDLTPYRVLVALSFDSTQSTRLPLREEMNLEIRDRLHRTFGKMWQVSVENRHSFAEIGSGGLKNLSASKVLLWFPENNPQNPSIPLWDKVFFAHVHFEASNLVVACREWDSLSRTLSSISRRVTFDPHKLSQNMVQVLEETFRPVISVDRVDNLKVYATSKAGTISPFDAASTQLEKDDVILPFFRYLDKKQVVQKIQLMPWTYLIVDKVEKSYIENTLISGIRSPLGTNRTKRVQLLGLKMNRKRDSSSLKLVLRSIRTEPMIGMRVKVFGKRQYRDKTTDDPRKIFSNRRGEVEIPFDKKHPIVWTYVYSGKTMLARVPFAPGFDDDKLLALRDDSIRLRMEGEWEMMLGDLVDLIAQRSALVAQAKTYARNKKFQEADKKLDEIAKLPGVKEFLQKLSEIKQPAEDGAKAVKNRWALRRIEELDRSMKQLLKRFLDPAKIDEYRASVEKIKLGKEE